MATKEQKLRYLRALADELERHDLMGVLDSTVLIRESASPVFKTPTAEAIVIFEAWRSDPAGTFSIPLEGVGTPLPGFGEDTEYDEVRESFECGVMECLREVLFGENE